MFSRARRCPCGCGRRTGKRRSSTLGWLRSSKAGGPVELLAELEAVAVEDQRLQHPVGKTIHETTRRFLFVRFRVFCVDRCCRSPKRTLKTDRDSIALAAALHIAYSERL